MKARTVWNKDDLSQFIAGLSRRTDMWKSQCGRAHIKQLSKLIQHREEKEPAKVDNEPTIKNMQQIYKVCQKYWAIL